MLDLHMPGSRQQNNSNHIAAANANNSKSSITLQLPGYVSPASMSSALPAFSPLRAPGGKLIISLCVKAQSKGPHPLET